MPTHLGASGTSEFLQVAVGTEHWEPAFELGVEAMIVEGDPNASGIYVLRVKWPPRVMSLPHSHPEDRHVTVISGTWYAGIGERFDPETAIATRPGSYMFHPAGAVHWDGSKDEETVIQIIGYGPSQMIPVTVRDAQFTRI